MKVRAVGKSHIGLKRKINEDNYLIAPEAGLFLVADGMGGHKAGEVASRMVVETIADYFQKLNRRNPPAFIQPPKKELSEGANHMVNAIVLSNMVIHEAQKKTRYRRMGSTVAALLAEEDCLWTANVGDSSVYLFEQGRLIQVSEEHSIEAEQRSLGMTNPDGSTNPLMRNVLTRVLGLSEKVNVYTNPIRPDAGDQILLCSDGLVDYVPIHSIKTVLDDRSLSSERKVDALIDEANRAGGGDNITVILVEVMKEGTWHKLKRRMAVKR
jgi:serine/threonine protein phosphatase PrpC